MTALLPAAVPRNEAHPLSLLPVLSPAAAKAISTTPAEIIARWIASVSEDARRAYSRALQTFTSWAIPGAADAQAGLRLLCEAGAGGAHELLAAWRDHLLATLAPGTVAGQVSAIASLLRCCRRAGIITFQVEGIAPRRERVQDRRGPRRAEVERLLAHVDDLAVRGDRRAVRDAAILRMLYCCAMRRGEVAGLRIEDVNLDAPEGATVSPRRKGAKTRQPLGVSERTAAAIASWLVLRGAEAGALFFRLDRAGERDHLTGESIRAMLAARAREAGVRSPARPHGLRHAAATELARRGSLDELMSLGGWKSLSAASAYLDKRDENRRRALALVDA
jgi:integrase/recombinase XerC